MTDTGSPSAPDTQASGGNVTELALVGMTCAACANRIERKLRKVDGVSATVNYALEKAHVEAPAHVTRDQLVEVVRAAGYDVAPEPEGDEPDEAAGAPEAVEALTRRLRVAAALTVPVVLLSMAPPLQFDGWQWVVFALATPVATWGAWPFHRAALRNARHGAATMDTLVSLGVTAAFAWSAYAMLLGTAGMIGMTHGFTLTADRSAASANIYFEAAAGITTFLLLGRLIEARSKRSAGEALRTLLDQGAKEATLRLIEPDGSVVESRVPASRIAVGDLVVVRPGETVAADGEVVDGTSALDTSVLTGESAPREVGPGDTVLGGSVNAGGRLVVRATVVGSQTQLARTARLVEEAQTGKAAVQRLADRVSSVFVPIVLAIAVATLIAWLLIDPPVAVSAAVAVLVIACPCALGLATPTALLVGSGRGSQLGIVIRGPEALERTRAVDTIVLDKTGTLTTARMSVVDVALAGQAERDGLEPDGDERRRLLALAGAVEAASEHPVARAVVAAAQESGEVPDVADPKNHPGLGASGTVRLAGRDHEVVIGRPALLADRGMQLDPALAAVVQEAIERGRTVVAVGWEDHVGGVLVVEDVVRPEAASAVQQLRELGLTPVLATGDHAGVAREVAARTGIDPAHVHADVLPAGKAELVRALQAEGRSVAMVGDGVNDAAALATADLGMAVGAGADVAIEAADLTLVREDLRVVPDAVRLSRATLRTIRSNLAWAFGYNVLALPIAAAGLLTPMVAGGAMAFSSVAVVLNSLRLRRFR